MNMTTFAKASGVSPTWVHNISIMFAGSCVLFVAGLGLVWLLLHYEGRPEQHWKMVVTLKVLLIFVVILLGVLASM